MLSVDEVQSENELVDTHCHIQSIGATIGEKATRERWAKAKDVTQESVIRDAQKAGVTRMICVGCDFEDSKLAIQCAETYPACWASIGIHPHEAQHYSSESTLRSEFEVLATENRVIAVGECGLDYYYEHSPKEAQRSVLTFQMELALKHDLPLIFHVREAYDDFWPIFDAHKGLRGVLHSYTDSQENVEQALQRGLYIGVNGIVTFAKDEAQLAVYRTIPIESLVLETDAPYLTPTPYRGSINEPKRVGTIVECLAGLRGESREHIAAKTTHNATTLFGF